MTHFARLTLPEPPSSHKFGTAKSELSRVSVIYISRVSTTSGETEDEIIINSDQYIVIFVFRERSVQEARAVSNVRLLVTTYV